MPFENEFASYEPLRRILASEKVQNLQSRFKIRQSEIDGEILSEELTDKLKLQPSDYQPDMILAVDGSYQAVKAENGFPGAEFGYVTVASVLILLEKIRELEKEEFIDPKHFRETEKAATIESVFPGCNVIIDDEASAKSSMRKALFEELKSNTVFSDGETLLETYEALLKVRLEGKQKGRVPKCPHDGCNANFAYDYGEYSCPACKRTLYSSDALRLHELMNPSGSNGELYGQIMSTFERLWLIHILRAFEQRKWMATLRRVAFMMDGPLAVFSTSAWLTSSIIVELERINSLAKEINGQDLIILGIEKSGTFVNHFEDLDTKKDGGKDNFPKQTALLLNDAYIKENIIFSQSTKIYGQDPDTYFGRKFFYKTSSGYRIVVSTAFLNKYQYDLTTAHVNQFPRLSDVMNLLDIMVSSRFENSVSPLISAHAEASIPLNLGRRIFEDIARELRKNS